MHGTRQPRPRGCRRRPRGAATAGLCALAVAFRPLGLGFSLARATSGTAQAPQAATPGRRQRSAAAGAPVRGGAVSARALQPGSNAGNFQGGSIVVKDTVRSVVIVAGMGGVLLGSWWLTGKWWKLPLVVALPSMLYRLWTTRMDTEKLAAVSASVDSKYVATDEKSKKELHMFMCSGCGYTLFPARGREAAFFTDDFKCPMCGAEKDEFFDMNEDDSDSNELESPTPESEPVYKDL